MKLNLFLGSRFCKDVLRVITMIAYVVVLIPSSQLSKLTCRSIARRCGMPTSGLAPPANPVTLLQEYQFVFEDQWKSRTEPDPILFSPVYDGRTDFTEDPFPCVEGEHLHILLEMMQDVIKLWLRQDSSLDAPHTDDKSVLQSLHGGILAMPSAHIPSLPCSNDHIYESCRLTSVLMVRSVQTARHWRNMAERDSILHQLREALQKTDLANLWGNKLGLLYWVILVFHCAAFGTPHYLLGHSIQTRVHFELTYSRTDWHGALKPMIALKDVMALCDDCMDID